MVSSTVRLFFVLAFVFATVMSGCTAPPVLTDQPPAVASMVERYIVGIDDTLSITVWRNPELSVSAVVRPDGMITVPVIGDVLAAGHAPEDIGADIRTQLSQFIRNPLVAVSVSALVSNAYLTRVRVTGAVNEPISITHRPGMTVLDVILEAGGLTEFAASDYAKLYRRTENQVKTYPVYIEQILSKGELSTNYELAPGDIITVPERIF